MYKNSGDSQSPYESSSGGSWSALICKSLHEFVHKSKYVWWHKCALRFVNSERAKQRFGNVYWDMTNV